MKFLMQFKHYFPFMAWIPMLDKPTIHTDIVAGITAGVLILPQAIALATLAGMPPEYGLYTAIFPVIIVGFFGSSWLSLSGPNTALAVLTAMTIAPFANIGTVDYVQYAITLTFMAGVVQLAFGLTRLGVVFNYFSHTVMVALVTGVGIIIVVQQVGLRPLFIIQHRTIDCTGDVILGILSGRTHVYDFVKLVQLFDGCYTGFFHGGQLVLPTRNMQSIRHYFARQMRREQFDEMESITAQIFVAADGYARGAGRK